MTVLYIILGIILFFIIFLSIPIALHFEYTDSIRLSIAWLFLKVNVIPMDKKEKKPKKDKKPKKPKKPKEKKETTEETSSENKDNIFKNFYDAKGLDGIIELIKKCASALAKFGKGFKNCFFIRKLRIKISVTESDAASTAIKYGEVCQKLYPPLGYICTNMHMKNYDANVYADYCGEKTKTQAEAKIHIIPIFLVNAAIAFAFRFAIQFIKVLITNFKYKSKNKNETNMKGGQEQ